MGSFVAQATASDTHEWPTEGWAVMASDKNYATLLADFRDAVEAAGMAVVTEAGPTEANTRQSGGERLSKRFCGDDSSRKRTRHD